MLNLNKIKNHLLNHKKVRISRIYKDNKSRNFVIYVLFWLSEGKIRLKINDYDIDLDERYGMSESDIPSKRHELKDFDTIEEVIDYILKTTIFTEEDFPNKFKLKDNEN
ncbi:MAG: hypothetical protein ABIG93_04725 [archaeon]